MFNGVPLLGFRHMVAPINKTEGAKDTLFGDKNPFGGWDGTSLWGSAEPKVSIAT